MMLRARSIGSVGVGLLLAGCYTLQPARGVTPEIGARVAFDVNDAGRVVLGGSMGPEIDQVEGNTEILAGKLQERYGWERDEAERQVKDFSRRHGWQ